LTEGQIAAEHGWLLKLQVDNMKSEHTIQVVLNALEEVMTSYLFNAY
jgi:hypothetical protein